MLAPAHHPAHPGWCQLHTPHGLHPTFILVFSSIHTLHLRPDRYTPNLRNITPLLSRNPRERMFSIGLHLSFPCCHISLPYIIGSVMLVSGSYGGGTTLIMGFSVPHCVLRRMLGYTDGQQLHR